MVWFIGIWTLAGYNFTFWFIVGIIRLIYEQLFPPKKNKFFLQPPIYKIKDVAAIVPAHNEELTIERTIIALLKVLPRKNIYVASDYSTDRTVEIVRKLGVRMLNINPNRGKARSLVWIMREYGLLKAYKLIMINDADTEVDKNYLKLALPYFNDPSIASIATHGVSRTGNYKFLHKYYIAYRLRLWRIIQLGMRFGQTWKYTNMTFIIPGSLSLYRTDVMKKLEIDAPGLIIEDFNMTFELRKKRLGKIAYSPQIFGIHQDPYTLRDYIRQIKRWNVGFFQTVKRHGIWFSFFWFFTTCYYLELYLYAIFIAGLPIIFVYFLLNNFQPITVPFVWGRLTVLDLFIGVFVMDYITTIIAAIAEKKPYILYYGVAFIFLRYVESMVYIISPFIAIFKSYSGTWSSPQRL